VAGLTPSAALDLVQRASAAAGAARQTPPAAASVPASSATRSALKSAPVATVPAAAPAMSAAGADLGVAKLAPQMDVRIGGGSGDGLRLSGTVGIVVMMGLLTLLPTLILMMTSFTRILIVLSFLRQALGTQNAPPAQLVAAMSLLLTCFVMAPTLTAVNRDALQPWMNGKIEQGEMMDRGAQPFKAFMLRQTRDHDLQVFVDLSRGPKPATAADVPLVTLMSAFVTSELRTAFQIGFALFLPFIIIDVVVSSVLMSMGMMMLPPAMISLPFKLLLFVLVDGWALIVQSLVASFR
jgi:flagellar biosynthesis protein FliP